MMLYESGRGIDPGSLRVRTNPGGKRGFFAVIELRDDASIFIFEAAEADALIAAAVEAKRLLDPPVAAPDGDGGVLVGPFDETGADL